MYKKNKNRIVSDDLVDLIRDSIITGELKPRERLVEEVLAQKFDVSRTPVREALKTLKHLGLIENEPYKGAIVADIDAKELIEIYEIRACLETLSAKKAVNNLTETTIEKLQECISAMEVERENYDMERFSEYDISFHRIINNCCGNNFLEKLIEELLEKTYAFRKTSWQNPKNMDKALQDHKELLNAIIDGNIDEVEKISMKHIRILISQGSNK